MWDTKKRAGLQSDSESFTVIGKDVIFKGIAHFESTVQLDSNFEGEIHAKGMLVIGEHAVIRATITAGTLVSSGKIHGNVTASTKVHLLKTAVLIGDVRTPSFSMEEGSYFKGFNDMGPSTWIDEPTQPSQSIPDLSPQRIMKTRPLLIEGEPAY
jgi:cytoskeletal protein CcmA (bactofilin family)